MDFVLVRMFVSTSERACGLCWCCCCCRCCCLDYWCSLSSFSVVNFSNLASPNIFLSFSFERNEKKETLLFLKLYSSLDYALQSGKYILFHALPLRMGQSERKRGQHTISHRLLSQCIYITGFCYKICIFCVASRTHCSYFRAKRK